jgi:transposase-like protein
MAGRAKLLTDLTLADLGKEITDPLTLWGDLSGEAQRTLTRLLRTRMREELLQHLLAPCDAHVSGHQGYRNGSHWRSLTTTWGTIPDLALPRSRDGGFRPAVVPRSQRRMATVGHLVQAVCLAGVSTRTLDHAVAAWHRRPSRRRTATSSSMASPSASTPSGRQAPPHPGR